MPDSVLDTEPLQPAEPSAPSRQRTWRDGLWALPLLLSVLFVACVVIWAQRNDAEEKDQLRKALITDALSAEAQLRNRLDLEDAHLRALGAQLSRLPRTQASLAQHPHVAAGFRRLWISVTWLDASNRIIAHVQEGLPRPELNRPGADEEGLGGLSSHLVASVSTQPKPVVAEGANRYDLPGEKLVVRYSPAALLKRGVPWWISQKYDVRLVDGSDRPVGTLGADSANSDSPSYEVAVGPGMPGAYLELSLRNPPRPWLREVPTVLIAGFLLLIGGTTWLLRRQVRQVSQAEAAWRTEAAWRSAMEDSALVGLRARDAQGRLLYVNRTFCDMVGLPAEQLLGQAPPMPYWPPDAIAEANQRSRRNLAGLAPREGYEAHWIHSSGRRLNVMVFESPLVDAQGRQIGWMGSIIDITQRKLLEERERHQSEAMAHQARLTTLGEVASALAHQLNQPLTAIASYNGGVLRSLERAGFDNEMVLQALRRQGEQAAEAGRIVQRIRGFLTRRSPQREACDLAATLKRAVELLQRDLSRQQVRVEWALDANLPEVLADPVLIEQVAINLVRNAMDELVGQGIAPGSRRIRIRATAAPPRLVSVEIEDSGPGLQARTVEQLAAPFYSTKADGMGMGLAICRSVIEAHRGALDASPSELGGACFSFTLPVYDEKRTRFDTHMTPTPAHSVVTPCVHLVDDEAPVRDALAFLLSSHGLPVRCYADGPSLLEALDKDALHGCIVLDVRMEPLSGLQVHDELIARGVALPVIFLSGHGDIPMAVDALKKGALDFVEKPFSDQALVDRVQRALALAESQRQAEQAQGAVDSRLSSLTDREREVMHRVAAGKLNKVIADELNVSVRTVEVHRARVFAKAGVRSAAELATLLAKLER